MQGLPGRAAVPFLLSGVASRGNSFPQGAPSLLGGREEEGLRGPGVKTFCRGLTCCSEMSETGCQWLPNPLSVTSGLHLLARWPCPGPTPCLKAKTSNSDLECVHHFILYRMISEPLVLLISGRTMHYYSYFTKLKKNEAWRNSVTCSRNQTSRWRNEASKWTLLF